MTVLVISPHLDDAILSIGASLARWNAAGRRVVIATMYTSGPPLAEVARAMRKFADYATRKREEAAACAVVGAAPMYLGQTERAFRLPRLTGLAYFRTPADRAGYPKLGAITAALEPLRALAPEEVLIPLGIGNHVDHVETVIAATDFAIDAGWLGRTRFYEDFYALSGTLRRRHFVARQQQWRSWQAPLLRTRRLALVMQAIASAGRGPTIEHFLRPALRDARWTLERAPLGGYEDAKLAAIECYGSQTRAFGGFAGIRRATRAYHACWDGAEPMWRPT